VLKHEALCLLYDEFVTQHLQVGSLRGRTFRQFVEHASPELLNYARFEAVREQLADAGPVPPWWQWPAMPAVSADEVQKHLYWQWLADTQLAEVEIMAARMGIRVYRDLALGASDDGADSAATSACTLKGCFAGAPPDALSPKGQCWGLPVWHPEKIFESQAQPFINLLCANMTHASALRIDHVMQLARLFVVPSQDGNPHQSPTSLGSTGGAYINYPVDMLMAVLCLESHRHRCIVIGEDLGTLPSHFRGLLSLRGILGHRVFIFERRTSGDFMPPELYPQDAVALINTHDMATLAGYWEERDIRQREVADLYNTAHDAENERHQRRWDRFRLRQLIRAYRPDAPLPVEGDCPETLLPAVLTYLNNSPARILLVALDDISGERDAVNLPGTNASWGNWRRRLALSLEDLARHQRWQATCQALSTRSSRSF
jgi:(1->4)-alpha-D-glucan 1-alpha-D-glucosylmutase